jgi:hypothetical protein
LGALTQLPQVGHLIGQLGLDHVQVPAASGGLPGCLLHLLGRLCLRPVARGLVHQQRDAAGALQHGIDRLPRCRLGPIDGKDLGHFIPVQGAEASASRAVGVQPFDNCGKLDRGRLVAVGAQDYKSPRGDGGRETSQRLQRRWRRQVQVVQDQQHCVIRLAGQHPCQSLPEGGRGLLLTGHVPNRCSLAHQQLRERL